MTDQTPVDPEMDALLDAAAANTPDITIGINNDVASLHDLSTKLGIILRKLEEHFEHHNETANRVINQ